MGTICSASNGSFASQNSGNNGNYTRLYGILRTVITSIITRPAVLGLPAAPPCLPAWALTSPNKTPLSANTLMSNALLSVIEASNVAVHKEHGHGQAAVRAACDFIANS